MTDPMVEKIRRNPKYQELKTKRTSFGWILTFCVLVLYYGFIALIAFDKALLAQPLGSGEETRSSIRGVERRA